MEKRRFYDKSFKGVDVPLVLKKEERNGALRFQLYVAEDVDEYMKGEPWATVNTAYQTLGKDRFALNHDFVNCCSLPLVMAVVDALAASTEPEGITALGFQVYRMKEEVIAW